MNSNDDDGLGRKWGWLITVGTGGLFWYAVYIVATHW